METIDVSGIKHTCVGDGSSWLKCRVVVLPRRHTFSNSQFTVTFPH